MVSKQVSNHGTCTTTWTQGQLNTENTMQLSKFINSSPNRVDCEVMLVNGKEQVKEINIPATPAQKNWQWVAASSTIELPKGAVQLRVRFNKGGINLKSIRIDADK